MSSVSSTLSMLHKNGDGLGKVGFLKPRPVVALLVGGPGTDQCSV